MKNICLTFFILSLFYTPVLAQKDSIDTAPQKSDSLRIYKKIEKLSKKNRWLYQGYKAVFKYSSPTHDTTAKKLITPKKKKNAPKPVRKKEIHDYEGQIIRHIYITSLDPSGYDIKDTSVKPSNFAEKAANFAHIKSRRFTIRNHLLFKRGDSLDPLKIKESERIIRTSAYIHDAIILAEPAGKSGDSVDVIIRTQDRWSLFPVYNYGGDYMVGLRDNNFIGFGQQVEQSAFTRGLSMDSTVYYKGNYSIPYIRNTFITASAFYNTDNRNQNKGASLIRPFYSPLTRWAGGIELNTFRKPTGIRTTDSLSNLYLLDYTTLDVWNGWSFPLFKSKSNIKRVTKLNLTYRYLHQTFRETIAPQLDPMLTFQNTDAWFVEIGISQRTFYKDKYIYRFGTTEDVPTGFLISFVGGLQNRHLGTLRTYGGIRVGLSGHLPNLVYASLYLETGSYVNQGLVEQGTTRMGFGTFTSLISLGNWKWRQFLVAEITYGTNRGPNEKISINNANGLKGFESPFLIGTNKFFAYLQSQLYLPYSVIGFKFAPVLYIGMGMVGTEDVLFIKNKPYPAIALGLQVRNELLVFSTFQFTFGYYPEIPGAGDHVFKFNPLRTYDLQFRQLQMDKPGEIPYY